MPQMKPLFWLMSLLLATLYLIMMMITNYFTSFSPHSNSSLLTLKKFYHSSWMWKW